MWGVLQRSSRNAVLECRASQAEKNPSLRGLRTRVWRLSALALPLEHEIWRPTASMEFRVDGASGEPKRSATQPFSDRRDTRSDTDGANDDKDSHDRDKPHRMYFNCPCWDHYGQDYDANDEPVEVHPPREQATQHHGSF
jgi:hypothetical protein